MSKEVRKLNVSNISSLRIGERVVFEYNNQRYKTSPVVSIMVRQINGNRSGFFIFETKNTKYEICASKVA